ncbi:hypothetical protein DEO72_LG6g958 [Vigna unguiculata]|uniref:Uncharacterized protein n=1 Tax=Vigna unguiculata TaxID=3917 RepID=A0A4D6M814_VIGUN|nr:hypothetical protein DEO72_LG6g958 [Vigna unguiculata]
MLELNNSRDIVPSHNTRNTTASRSLRYHSKSCRPRTTKAYKSYATTSLSDAAPKPPVEIQFQTAWRKPRAAKRQAPSPLGAMRLNGSLEWYLSLGGSTTTIRRYTSTHTILVLAHQYKL